MGTFDLLEALGVSLGGVHVIPGVVSFLGFLSRFCGASGGYQWHVSPMSGAWRGRSGVLVPLRRPVRVIGLEAKLLGVFFGLLRWLVMMTRAHWWVMVPQWSSQFFRGRSRG